MVFLTCGAAAVPTVKTQGDNALLPQPAVPHSLAPRRARFQATEYDRVLSELNSELLKAYHTKDANNRTSIYPLLSLMVATEVEDED